MRESLFRSLVLFFAAVSGACGQRIETPNHLANLQPRPGIELLDHDAKANTLSLRLTAPALRHELVTVSNRTFERLSMEGFDSSASDGDVELPTAQALLRVPFGMTPKVEIVAQSTPQEIYLDAPIMHAGALGQHCGDVVLEANPFQNGKRYAPVDLTSPDFAGYYLVSRLTFQPVRYLPLARMIQVTDSIEVRISFVPAATSLSAPPVSRPQIAAEQLFINPAPLAGDPSTQDLSSGIDLIIAHASYETVLGPYADFKRNHGREVRLKLVNQPSRDEVRQIIRAEYASATPPTTVLLVGSIDQIPAYRTGSVWTDFYYTNLDSGQNPDLAIGRIPAQTPDELQAYLDKAIKRQSEAREAGKVLLTAGSDSSLGCPANVDQIGQIIKSREENYQVTKLYRLNGATQGQIINGYNQNPNLVVYDGHGDQSGMTEIPFRIANLPSLTNGTYPIIFDIACLNAYWPSSGARSRNFAENILLQPSHGAAGIIAAGGNSGGHSFFRSATTKMLERDAAGGHRFNEIGHAVMTAKIQAGSDDRTMFGYYGDPAISVFE